MNIGEFLQENIFYTPEKKKEINDALNRNYGSVVPANAQVTPGAAAPQIKINRPTSRYSSGNPGGPSISLPKGQSPAERSTNRRGGGAKGRDVNVNIPTEQPIRGRTGAARGTTPKATTPAAVTPRVIGDGLADYRGSVTPGSMEPAMNNKGEGIQMDIADRFRPGAGYPAGVVRPMDYANNPGEVQPILDGTGTNTSATRALPELTYDAFSRDILAKVGIGTYAAQNLPGTPGYAEEMAVNAGDIQGFMEDTGRSEQDARAILSGGGLETVFEPGKEPESKPMKSEMSRIEKATSDIKPMERKLSGLDAGSRAFLDYEGGILGAMRARDEALGVAYVGGNYYGIDRDVDATSAESLQKLDIGEGESVRDAAKAFAKSKIEQTKAMMSENPTELKPDSPAEDDMSVGELRTALDERGEEVRKTNPDSFEEDPQYAQMRDALFTKRAAAGLDF